MGNVTKIMGESNLILKYLCLGFKWLKCFDSYVLEMGFQYRVYCENLCFSFKNTYLMSFLDTFNRLFFKKLRPVTFFVTGCRATGK